MTSSSPASLSVLLLDDVPMTLQHVSGLLADLGAHPIHAVADGAAGLRVYDQMTAPPALVLCDLNMPGMDGVEFLRHLAERKYQGGVALLSAMDTGVLKAVESMVSAYGLRFLGALDKPVEARELAKLLERTQTDPQTMPRAIPPSLDVLSLDELRRGLSEQQVLVYFQPKVAVIDRRLLSAECLARWRHPQRGILGPAHFIDVLEEHQLIDEFTAQVLQLSARQLAVWRKRGLDLKLSVNVSMDNLHQLDLPEIYAGIVRAEGIEPHDMVLEITESRLPQDMGVSLDILSRLRLMGFGLSIDDFGTGYSTLEHLRHMPFTELKVDRSFVTGASEDQAAIAILHSSVNLGRHFQLNLVAEGVETEQDWQQVVISGFDEAQGYLVARPMPAEEFEHWFSAQTPVVPERKTTLLVVDDDPVTLHILSSVLNDYRVLTCSDGETALNLFYREAPALVLLDVDMPGKNGYEICADLRAQGSDVPIIFVSGQTRLEDCVQGYEAGGDDYVTKPFDPASLEARIAHLLKLAESRRDMLEMAHMASATAMTAMTSMNEMGALLEALRQFNAADNYVGLADAMVHALQSYGLQGVVQLRPPEGGSLTRSAVGDATPLELAVMKQMLAMERIFQFKSRLAVTYEHASMLVQNMPSDDERCGRLRDHLAMLVEGAETRVQGLAAAATALRRGQVIQQTVAQIADALQRIATEQRKSQEHANQVVGELLESFEAALMGATLSDEMDAFLAGIVREGIQRIIDELAAGSRQQDHLHAVIADLDRAMSA